jgi:hypothetical protein
MMLVLRRVAWIADGRGPPLPSIAESCELVTDADFLELLSRRACRFHAWPAARPRAGWHEPGHGTRLPHIDNAMVKAIARAIRWREMLENGTQATIAKI